MVKSLSGLSGDAQAGFGCGIGLGWWFGCHAHHGCGWHQGGLQVNIHFITAPGGRLWAGHGPCSIQPHELSSLSWLPSYTKSTTQELVTLLSQLPTQLMVKAGAAAHFGCSHQDRRLNTFIPAPGRRSEVVTRGSPPSQTLG